MQRRLFALVSMFFVQACDGGGAGYDAGSQGGVGGTGAQGGAGGGDGGGAGSGGQGGGAAAGGCPDTFDGTPTSVFDSPPSRFALRAYPEWMSFTGALLDGPSVEFHAETERSGLCRLLTYTPTTCSPECPTTSVCVDGSCAEHPGTEPAGTLTLIGIGTSSFELEANELESYDWSTESFGLDDVSNLEIHASGGAVPAFELQACVVPPPEPRADWSAALEARQAGQSVTLEWSNPVETARLYLRMTTGIGTHGGISPVEIECEGPDRGLLELPGTFLDALYREGWSCGECGYNELFRYHAVETQAGARRVQLRATSSTAFWHIPRGGGRRADSTAQRL